MPTALICPVRCPSCGEPLPPAVAPSVLAAAKVILAAPGGEGTSEDVAAALGITRRAASSLLHRAATDGLLALVDTMPTASGYGRHLAVFAAVAPIIGAYP